MDEICPECGDSKIIYRPEYIVEETTIEELWDDYYQSFIQQNPVVSERKIGGTDACPACAGKSEAEWRANNGNTYLPTAKSNGKRQGGTLLVQQRRRKRTFQPNTEDGEDNGRRTTEIK